MIDDVGKTIKAILYDRIASPLFGTFILSWCGWNWRLILLFISDSSTTVAKKFQYVDSELYPSNGVTFIYGLLLPATTTAFFIYVYPPIARKVYGYWREQQNKLKRVQIEKDGETPITQKEKQEIIGETLLAEIRNQEEREKREARIRDLENLVKSLQTSDSAQSKSQIAPVEVKKKISLNKSSLVYSEEVERGMLSVLKILSELSPNDLIDKHEYMNARHSSKSLGPRLSGKDVTFFLHCLDNLVDGGYIAKYASDSIKILPKGRTALINNKLDNVNT